jgi:hypothetical protein
MILLRVTFVRREQMGQERVREPRRGGTLAVESRYQATVSEE